MVKIFFLSSFLLSCVSEEVLQERKLASNDRTENTKYTVYYLEPIKNWYDLKLNKDHPEYKRMFNKTEEHFIKEKEWYEKLISSYEKKILLDLLKSQDHYLISIGCLISLKMMQELKFFS